MSRERTTSRRVVDRGAKKPPSRRLRGEAARQRLEEELAKQQAMAEERKNRTRQPFRFRLSQGETREVIIVDDAPDFMMYEHAGLKDPRTDRWGLNLQCCRDYDNCPICEHEKKEAPYCLYLTVIDLNEFTDRAGNVHEFSRKLFVVKPNQIKKFTRRYAKDGTLRGARFELSRDGQKDPVIGNDIEFIENVPEEELEQYTRSWRDHEGKEHTELCYEPFDYDELFPEKTGEELGEEYDAIFGTRSSPTPGSRRANERTTTPSRRPVREEQEEDYEDGEAGDEDYDDDAPPFDMEDIEFTETESEEDEEEDAEEEPAPARRAVRRPRTNTAAGTRRTVRRK